MGLTITFRNHPIRTKPTKNQAELDSKRKKLKELQGQEKNLTKSLPIDTQISVLQKEIQTLTNKPAKTKAEENLLANKKKELEELLKKQSNSNTENKPSDRTGLYWGLGIVGTLVLLFAIVLVINHQRRVKEISSNIIDKVKI